MSLSAVRGRLAVMTVGHVIDDVYQGAVPALLPFLVADRHYSYAAATGITLAATFLSSVVQPVFGVLTDRRRMAWLIPLGIALAGLGVGLSGVHDSYWWTWSAIALSGVGVAAYHPEASRTARMVAGRSAVGMSVFALGGNLGFALGPLLVTPIVASGGLAATPLLALPALVGAVLMLVVVRGGRGTVRTHHTGEDNWRAFRWLTGVVVCRSIAFFGVSSLLGLYVIRNLGQDTAAGNTALTVFLASGAVGTLIGGWLADRYGRLRAVRAGYVLTLPALAVLLTAPTIAVAYVAAILLGLALYVPFSVHVTLGQEYLPRHIGTASGVTLGLAVSVGGVVAPLLGTLADHAGLTVALGTLFVFPIVSLLVSTRLPETGHVRTARVPLSR
jgi:FSR family fosmidomycin resistance protein-like MFS transporter